MDDIPITWGQYQFWKRTLKGVGLAQFEGLLVGISSGAAAFAAKERYQTSSALFTVTRWHDDTSFSTFRLARGQAGTFGLIFPACPRESKSSEITVISVTLSSRSRLLPNQKSKTYSAKVRHLRHKSQGLTPRNPLAYEPQSNHKALKNQISQAFRSDTKQGM